MEALTNSFDPSISDGEVRLPFAHPRRPSHPLCQDVRRPPSTDFPREEEEDSNDENHVSERENVSPEPPSNLKRKFHESPVQIHNASSSDHAATNYVNGNSATYSTNKMARASEGIISRPVPKERTFRSRSMVASVSTTVTEMEETEQSSQQSTVEMTASQRSTVSSTYSSLLVGNNRATLRKSMAPLDGICLDMLHNAVDDLVHAMVPNNLYTLICEHLPAFAKRYEACLPTSMATWRTKTIESLCQKVRETDAFLLLEGAIPDLIRCKEDPALLARELQKRDPAVALATSRAPRELAKILRHNQKLLDKARREEAEKKAAVAEKAAQLAALHQRTLEKMRILEQLVERKRTSGGQVDVFKSLLEKATSPSDTLGRTLEASSSCKE